MLTKRRGNCNLHHHHRSWVDASIDVGHEAGSETTRHLVAGCGEGRLGDGVVLHLEVEHDHVTDSGADGVGRVHKTCGTTNSDLDTLV